MFDQLSDRIATAVVTGLDVAVEFATLGEYRLAADPGPQAAAIAPRAGRDRRPFDGAGVFTSRPDPALPRPSTAAIRDEREAIRDDRPATPSVLAICSSRTRGKTAVPDGHSRPRTRGGAVEAPEQLCLWP